MHSPLRVYPARSAAAASGVSRAVTILACFGLTACGERPSAQNTAAESEVSSATSGRNAGGKAASAAAVCELLTSDEVGRVLGSSVTPPKEQIISPAAPNRAALSQCVFNAEGSPGKSVTLFLRQSPVRDDDPAPVRSTMAASGVSVTDVPGLGKAALWGGSALHVFQGNNYFILTLRGITPDDKALESARELATSVLKRLESR